MTGMINLTLSLNFQGHMDVFRDSLKDIIRHRCEIISTPPPPLARVRKALILKWFISAKGESHVIVRALLDMLATGDWDSDNIQIYVPPGVAHDRDRLFDTTAEGIAQAIAHKNFTLYQRKKWMGADEACCEFAVPLLLGNTLVHAHRLFCRRVRKGTTHGDVALVLDQAAHQAPAHPGMLAIGDGEDDEARVQREEDDGDPRGQAPIAIWAREVARKRKIALDWLRGCSGTPPCAEVVVLKMIVSVVQSMQSEELWIGSK
eukprot:7857343-Pyramimonas_sp.AAC.1